MSTMKRSCEDRTAILDPEQYKVAWIAPLEIEARAALCLLDERHHGRFPVSRGDDYIFEAGVMGGHNIIIATLPAGQEYGNGSAAALASQLKKCFPNLWFGLLVGVAAGLPNISRGRDIRLGDILVGLPDGNSAGLIAYDLGKEIEDGFELLRHGHSLAMTEPIVLSAIGNIKLQAPNERDNFLPYYEKIANLDHPTGTFADPGQDYDILYDDESQMIQRSSRPAHKRSRVWYGPIGSGDKLLKNAEKRNLLRDKYDLIGLEMEAAGTINRIPVGAIRGVCDYGDRHKNKDWQPYAAAMAASYARSLLDVIRPSLPSAFDSRTEANQQQRTAESFLKALNEMAFGEDQVNRIALVGLGGVGKTQIALQFAYQVKEKYPHHSIFWVPTLSGEGAERVYVEIARRLGVQKTNDDDDVKELVCQHLASGKAGKWLLIVDNADDPDLILGNGENPGLERYLPLSDNGIVLITTRARQIAVDLAQSDVLYVEEMDREEAICLLTTSLIHKPQTGNEELILQLLTKLTFLPLAISQASAYLNQNKAPIRTYLKLLGGAESEIQKSDPFAVNLLSFISYIEPKAIPQYILPGTAPSELESAIGTLCAYSFLVRREETDTFDMHSLVHSATRAWLEKQERGRRTFQDAMSHLAARFPVEYDLDYSLRSMYVPHATRLLTHNHEERDDDTYTLLEKLSWSFMDDRRFREASNCAEEVCHWRRSILPETDQLRLRAEDTLGASYVENRRIEEAIEILSNVVKAQSEILAEDDLGRLGSEYSLGVAYTYGRRVSDAIKILEHVVDVGKGLGEEDRGRLKWENGLAAAYLNNGQMEEAIEILQHIINIQKRTLQDSHIDYLASRHSLGCAFLNSGQTEKALEIFESLKATCVKTLGEDDLLRLSNEECLGVAYLRLGRAGDAITNLELVVEIWGRILPEKDSSRLVSEQCLARAYLLDGRTPDAIKILDHVVGIRRKHSPAEDPWGLASERDLADAYQKVGRIQEAIEILEHVVSIEADTLMEDDPIRWGSNRLLQNCYDKFQEAVD
ncbi:hypothetical protein FOXB_12370 [Fusarium oxysporum f. sp. conglutinans Fo5176]|uniref:NB-ARC domain-containing protein n=2 Tax=Fusarium oxysporum f. sp. conglutinans TaxID=100902 RepID=F9G138_FUSOF|nr:hypothetical protein FOXB_12370 [Fusarium oxysporum f. sp. conglutinans Fo5176]